MSNTGSYNWVGPTTVVASYTAPSSSNARATYNIYNSGTKVHTATDNHYY